MIVTDVMNTARYIGERVSLTAVGAPEGLKPLWVITDPHIKNYVVLKPGPKPKPPLPGQPDPPPRTTHGRVEYFSYNDRFNKQSISYYYTEAAPQAKVTLSFVFDGFIPIQSVKTGFNVKEPLGEGNKPLAMSVSTGMSTVEEGQFLSRNGFAGITVHTNAPTKGTLSYVQLMYFEYDLVDSPQGRFQPMSGGPNVGLDSQYPYSEGNFLDFTDSPGFAGGLHDWQEYKYLGTFRVWVMWRSDKAGSIDVPLRKLDWHFRRYQVRDVNGQWVVHRNEYSKFGGGLLGAQGKDEDARGEFPEWSILVEPPTLKEKQP